MGLSYAYKLKVEQEGFKITNYGEYLENHKSYWIVDIKPVSSWSCFHGVGRWSEDCGCSTGGHPGWSQKWRKPLREALDYLRDETVSIYKNHAKKYFVNPKEARENYISVILDRSETNVKKFQDEFFLPNLEHDMKVKAMKLLEIQRQAMLMYTSCGWFFSEISGIETVQIMKYAARVIQLLKDFSRKDFETPFLEILSEAQSNIPEFGNGKDIFERFVRPSIVTPKQIACLWAVSSLYRDVDDEEMVYCYKIKQHSYKKIANADSQLVIGNIEVESQITLERNNMVFALLQFSDGNFHCAISGYTDDYLDIRKDLIQTYMSSPVTGILRAIDKHFGEEYFTLKDIFIEARQQLLKTLLKDKLASFANTYETLYNEGKGSIYQLCSLGLETPVEFKLAAQYVLAKQFNALFEHVKYPTFEAIQKGVAICNEAKNLGIEIDKTATNAKFSRKIAQSVSRLASSLEIQQAESTLELLGNISDLDLQVDISDAQSIYFGKIVSSFGEIIKNIDYRLDKDLISLLFEIGKRLNINTEYYEQMFNKVLVNAINKEDI